MLNLNTSFDISKSRHNIFEIGNINLKPKILDIISLGLKFVPTFSKIDLYYLLFNFYNSLNRLNNSCIINYFSKDKNLQNTTIQNSITTYLNNRFEKNHKYTKTLYFINDFRIEFLKNFNKFINSKKDNLEMDLNNFKYMINSLKKNNYTIALADKNISIVIINTIIYNNLCFEHLNDSITYKKIELNPQFEIYKNARNILTKLNKNGHISNRLFKCIFHKIRNKKLANFKILMKLHKPNKFGVRPLVNCSNNTLSALSKTLDFYLKPIMQQHYSFIKDSQNLIQKTKDMKFDSSYRIYSADFESLYSNIPLDKSINIIMEMISNVFHEDIDNNAFYEILKLVLLNNYFYFKHNNLYTFYLQIKGVAMGTACGPSIANLYLAYFEIKYKNFLNNSLYYRFIDDLIYLDKNDFITNKFTTIFPDLKLTSVTGSKVQFLDTYISFDNDFSIKYNLFIKPTFTGSYLNTKSNHPKFIYRGIIISLISRIRRICTDLNDYFYHSLDLLSHLLKKGYKFELIMNIIRSFSNIERETLICYKDKNLNNNGKSVYFISFYNKHFNFDHYYISYIWKSILPENSKLKEFKIKNLYKNMPNMSYYFVTNLKNQFFDSSYKKCNSLKCKICIFGIDSKFIYNTHFDRSISIHSDTSCVSKNIIYFIYCIKCSKTYIGESSRSASLRISEHISRIKYFKKNKEDSEIENKLLNSKDSVHLYNHFRKEDHNLKDHFRFQIYIKNIISYRLRMETDLIYIFNSLYPNGLNNSVSKNNLYLQSYRPP